MKKYILSALVVSSATLFTACNDMLDTDPRVTDMTTATFPGKPADVEALNAATYSIMNTLGGGDQSGILNNPFYWWSLMSDDCYGSGGLQDNVAKSLHHFTTASSNQYEQDFILLYGGISRANNQISIMLNGRKLRKHSVISCLARATSCVVSIICGFPSCMVMCL